MTFIESIKLLNGDLKNLEFHQERVRKTYAHFFKTKPLFSLHQLPENMTLPLHGTYKLRVIYNHKKVETEVVPYRVKQIKSLAVVEHNHIEYAYKSASREVFSLLKKEVVAEEIIIVKNNLVTDGSYANLVFFDGEKWITPTSYLLNGTCRQRLLLEGKITEQVVRKQDIATYKKIGFINALIGLGEMQMDIKNITL